MIFQKVRLLKKKNSTPPHPPAPPPPHHTFLIQYPPISLYIYLPPFLFHNPHYSLSSLTFSLQNYNMFTTSDNQMLQCPPMPMAMERRWNKSNHVEIAPNCPRCASPNTKFCYYNNYSLSQPRYFCKGCRRYWTKGGSLRNVPVGGGYRKNRRSRSSVQPDSASTSYARNPPSPGRSSSNSATVSHSGPEGSLDIDLAAVYANYLNQNSGSENNVVADQDTSSGANCASYNFSVQNSEIQLENLIEIENSFDLLDETQLHEELHQVGIGEDNFQDFVMQNPNNFELPEEVPWNMDATNFSNFAWQPLVQMQDFGSFSHERQLNFY